MTQEDHYNNEFLEIENLVKSGHFQAASQRIKQNIERDFQGMAGGGRRVSLANWMLLAADWNTVTKLLPPLTNFFATSGWLASMHLGRPVNGSGEPIPWLTYPATDFLEGKLAKDWTVFEYGAGSSTIWWANKVAAVCSVEDDAAWYGAVVRSKKDNVTIVHATDKQAYVEAIARPGCRFNAVIIDGSHRNDCARAALRHVADDGFIVFDNSDLVEYEEGLNALAENGWVRLDFFGLVPGYAYKNCTSIFVRDLEVLRAGNQVLPGRAALSTGVTCSQGVRRSSGQP